MFRSLYSLLGIRSYQEFWSKGAIPELRLLKTSTIYAYEKHRDVIHKRNTELRGC